MTVHDHRTYVEGCYRCELSRDEVVTTPADPPPSFPFIEVNGVEWCYVHEAEFVEGNPECGMGDQSDLPCMTIALFYRAGDS